jgi:hypothetical protein
MDDRACCCPARPMVRVLMPATPSRPYRVLPGRRAADMFEMALL